MLASRRLFHQFLVDSFSTIESDRLRYMRDHQKDLRAAMYKGLTEAIVSGDCVANVTGKRIVLPASFVGGARYMIQNYQDAMTICSWAAYPDYADTSTGITAASMYRQNTGAGIGKKRARKAVAKGGSSNISQINHIPDFMHSYVESITDVKSDGNCGYRVIALGHTNNEDDYDFIKKSMLDELQLHKQDYLKIYGGGERLSYIRNALLPAKRKARRHGVALIDKWLTFPDMGHIVASILGKVVVKLTKHGASETFFPLRGVPSSNPSSLIICLGAIPGHYVHVNLKDGCPIPPTSIQWKQHCSTEAIVWESYFVDRQANFTKLMKDHMVHHKKDVRAGSKSCYPIDL
ncbi:uncharacterized protein LOC123884059 [Trifolium pratense]|uniref:uncharacterized protein LOC123884059 n=1 Tax=Trifolium pratense TaxID=57577 RepID=UPI001E6978BE|nr:uncharacterized protein LOC123884059 [Trifolium pratense]